MIIHDSEPCLSCEHYSPDTREINHWVCHFDHDTCPHIEALHKAVGYKKWIDAEVLDMIRTEIEQLPTSLEYPDIEYIYGVTKKQLLGIIDKYKAERSDKE